MVPTIVPDTTELERAQVLTSGGWGDLLNRCRRGDLRIVVPDVVIREAARHFGPAVAKELAPSTRLLETLRSLGVADLPDLEEVRSAIGDPQAFYIERLRSRLERHDAVVAPVPEVSQEQILARDLAGRKPFIASGKGYRDALIWETVLELVRSLPEGDVVYLVTKNKGDFANDDGGLAADLDADLVALDRPGVVVRVDTAVQLRDHLGEHFELIDAEVAETWSTSIDRDDTEDVALDAVMGKVESLPGDLTVGPGDDADITVPAEVEEATLEALDPDAGTFDYWIYDTFDGDTTALGASIEADATVDGYMYKSDWYGLYEDEEEDRRIRVLDPDWNDHYVLVQVEMRLRLTFQLLVVGEGVEDISVDSVEVLPAPQVFGPSILEG